MMKLITGSETPHSQPTFSSEETGQDSSPPLGELEGAGRLTKESRTIETITNNYV